MDGGRGCRECRTVAGAAASVVGARGAGWTAYKGRRREHEMRADICTMTVELGERKSAPEGEQAGKKAGGETPEEDLALALILLHLAHEGVRPDTQKASHRARNWPRHPVTLRDGSQASQATQATTTSPQPRRTSRRTSPRVISMDTHYNAGLVYHQHPGTAVFPTPASLYPPNPHDMSWHGHHSPPSSSSTEHAMYSPVSRSQDHPDYDPQPSPTMPKHDCPLDESPSES